MSEKLRLLPGEIHQLLSLTAQAKLPAQPARELEVRSIRELPPKLGLSSASGQARLIHDLASIELQAMELAIRTLREFPGAPQDFREDLAELALDEGRHLSLCLACIQELGHRWGDWPVHLGLWMAVDAQDSLLDRILIVHRYLEGSGLDAGGTMLRRLEGLNQPTPALDVVRLIRQEEVGHVRFGGDWYRKICQQEGLDEQNDFAPRLAGLFHRLPRRLERLDRDFRRQAGFTDYEMNQIEILQARWFDRNSALIHRGLDKMSP